ncbi:MAG: AAA family ATPase, partial [Candidatus Diapherotrites archaeon]|nr:AAA family ATPase [Candidatus Diapherotrites archaeon]
RRVAKLQTQKGAVVVLVCGPQGSGKTKLTSRLAKDLNAGLIHTDAYYKPFEVVDRLTLYFDDPRAVDYEQMVQDIENWKLGKDIEMPVHDPKTHRLAGTKKIQHRKVLFVEGIMAFHPKLIKLADLRVYIEASPSKRLKRRLRRDVRERGRTVQHVRDRFYSTVERARLRFLEKWKPKADLIIIS